MLSGTSDNSSIVLHVDGYEIARVHASDACRAAALLVFLGHGYMMRSSENGTITEWNMNHPFFAEYAKLVHLKLKG